MFKVGQTVKCCGGSDGIILAITEKRVMVAMPVESIHMVKIAVGHYPLEYDGELVWDWGHYYHVTEQSPEMIAKAWADWNKKH